MPVPQFDPPSGPSDSAPTPETTTPALRRTLQLLLAVAKDHELRDPQRSVECFREASDLARSLGDRSEEIDALVQSGRIEVRRGNAAAAEDPLTRALALARQAWADQASMGRTAAVDGQSDRARCAAAHNAMGFLRLRQGRLDESSAALREALALTTDGAGSTLATQARAETLELLGTVYAHRGDPAIALRHHQEALEIRRATQDLPGEARNWNQIGNLRHRMGQYAEAVASYRQALGRFRELDDSRAVAAAANNLASTLLRLGETGEARSLFEECRARFEGMRETARVADVLSNLGLLAQGEGRAEEAEEHYRESLRRRKEGADAPGEAHSLTNLAHLALVRGQYEQSLALSAESAAILERAGFEETLASVLVCAGSALLESGRIDEARVEAQRARSVAQRAEAADQRAESLLLIARIELADGAAGEAVEAAEEALRLAEQVGDPELLAGACGVLGAVRTDCGDLDGAKELLSRAVRLLRGWEHSFERARLQVEEARLLARTGAQAAAAERLRRADATFLRLGNSTWRSRTLDLLANAVETTDPTQAAEARARARELAPVGPDIAGLASPGATPLAQAAGALRDLLSDLQAAQDAPSGAGGRREAARTRFELRVREARCGAEDETAWLAAGAAAMTISFRDDPGPTAQSREDSPVAEGYGPLVGASSAMQEVYDLVDRAAASDATVLLRGESGTGKELVARCLHERSARAAQPFVAINCPSIPRDLIESELFGHERGAFTGATETRSGRIELAQGGTLFLDEIGDIPVTVQAKLLRFLQEREIERVGGRVSIRVDVRLIAATSRDLEAAMVRSEFREDLYYRLAVIPIRVPPLRDRMDDLPLLVGRFLADLGLAPDGRTRRITTAALDRLLAHAWPGNVRELKNAVEYMGAMAPDSALDVRHLPGSIRGQTRRGRAPAAPDRIAAAELRPGETLESRLMEVESALLRSTLEACGWNQSAAARRLGLTESMVRNRMRQYGLRRSPAPAARREEQ